MTPEPRAGALLGVNLPWFFGAYGHDLAPNERVPDWPCDFDTLLAYRPMVEARDLGFAAMRVWVCESGEGIVTRDGRVAGVHEQLLEHVRVVQESAKLLGLRVYWTLLDGNSWQREKDPVSHRILVDPDETERFAEHVAAPLTKIFDPALTVAVEVVNEPEAMTAECMAGSKDTPLSWSEIGRAVRTVGDAIREARPGTLVTAGTLHVFLPRLWGAESHIDAVDVHVYHTTGGLPSRADLAKYVGDDRLLDTALPLIGGECGIPDDAPLESFELLPNYLFNAAKDGYDAAFLWRLERVLIESREAERPLTPLGREVQTALKRMNRLK